VNDKIFLLHLHVIMVYQRTLFVFMSCQTWIWKYWNGKSILKKKQKQTKPVKYNPLAIKRLW